MHIHPDHDLHHALLRVDKPGRYVGGEYGAHTPDTSAPLRIAICFPDLYEIGMTNRAIRILYDRFERIPGVSAERVFAVAPDFEEELKSASMPLYSLESGTPLHEFDIVAFSIGYELAATSVLSVLELGGIDISCASRGANQPIVIAGGPAVTNPVPFGRFIDAILIGEVEERFAGLLERLVAMKKGGGRRDELLQEITSVPSIWSPWNPKQVSIDRFSEFGLFPEHSALPIPGLRVVQDHGAVEIMRGCPNGCRFCHAGIFYRPYREKPFDVIAEEVEWLVSKCGYREVTISSLSSGDYSDIFRLIRRLNLQFGARGVSFSLPSIRIDSFTLPLLEQVSTVRKSGLTFAVETPRPEWQRGINKEVSLEKTVAIMDEAKRNGWHQAKFYFMLGLPVGQGEDETPAIAEFIDEVRRRSGMHINVNLSTFVPKPHTPFQWSPQLDETESNRRIQWLKSEMRGKPVAVRYNSPFSSVVEGIICRGDERVGDLIEDAYLRGSRLDAWDDHFDRNAWRDAIEASEWKPVETSLAGRSLDSALPWDDVSLGIRQAVLKREYERALRGERTDPCCNNCTANCGVCRPAIGVRTAGEAAEANEVASSPNQEEKPDAPGATPIGTISVELPEFIVDFRYEKLGRAAYLAHLDTLRMFGRAFSRAGIRVAFSRGFNPKPRLEFAHPLSLGYESTDEIARVIVVGKPGDFVAKMAGVLHDGYRVLNADVRPKPERRVQALMAQHWGSEYELCVPVDWTFPGSDLHGADALSTALHDEARLREIESALDILGGDDVNGSSAPHRPLDSKIEAVCIRLQSAGKESSLRRMLTSIDEHSGILDVVRVVRTQTFKVDERPPGYSPFL